MRIHATRSLAVLVGCFAVAVSAAAAEPKTADEYITRGLRYLDTWQWPEALADANEALRLQPGSARALLVRGAAKVGMEDVGAGLRDLAEAEKRGEKSARLYCEQGLAYCAVRQYDKAMEAAERARKIDPKEPRVYGLRGKAPRRQKGLVAALEDLDKAVALDSDSGYGHGVRGEVTADWDIHLGPSPPDIALVRRRFPTVAEEDLPALLTWCEFTMAIQSDPENPRITMTRRRPLPAAAAASTARCATWTARSRSNPKFALAYQQRMWVRLWLNDGPGSEADAVRLIELSPANYWGHHAHGWGLVRQGKADEAMKEINLAIKLAPNLAARDYTIRALYGLSRARILRSGRRCHHGLGDRSPSTRRASGPRRRPLSDQAVEESRRRFQDPGPGCPRLCRLLDVSRRSQVGDGGR